MAFVNVNAVAPFKGKGFIGGVSTGKAGGAHLAKMGMEGREVSRRAVLSGFAAAAALSLLGGPALADEEELKELKEDVEKLSYEEELLDVGPDPVEKSKLRVKPKPEVPSYRVKEQALTEAEEKKYDEMVAEELSEEKSLKEKYEEYIRSKAKARAK